MPSPFKVFFGIFLAITLLGLLAGTLNLMNPKAVYISNGLPGSGAEGLDGVIASVLSSGALGIGFGAVAALFAWLAKVGVNRAGVNRTEAIDEDKPGEAKEW